MPIMNLILYGRLAPKPVDTCLSGVISITSSTMNFFILPIDDLHRIPDANLADWLGVTASDFRTLTGLNMDVSNVEVEYIFPNNIKAQLIRIVQEALANIRKHAQSCTVSISAVERNSEVIIEVKDNGRGFTPEDVDSISHYGLRSMRERAESVGADFQVISALGMGTTIRLQIPIREKANL